MTDKKQHVSAVRRHYDSLSGLYHRFWGEHIHHGLWTGDETPAEAQVNLVRHLATRAAVRAGSRVLDIGCGLGGSAMWLAEEKGCEVVGLTLSPVQVRLATGEARRRGLAGRATFREFDANELRSLAGSFDVIWIVECSEHVVDKRAFFRECGRLLVPGGSLVLAAWLRGEKGQEGSGRELVQRISEAMVCASIDTAGEHDMWLREGGFAEVRFEDLTAAVSRTWDLCARIAERAEVRLLLRFADAPTQAFASSFDEMRRAYAEGAMRYGVFTGRRGKTVGLAP